MERASRELVIGLGTAVLVVGTMAIGHLVGTGVDPGEDDAALEDPGAFVVSVVLSLALLAALFRYAVRRADDPDRAARLALAFAVVGVVALPLVFLGLPLPPAGAAVALGLRGGADRRRALATSAVVIGAAVLVLVSAAYVAALVA